MRASSIREAIRLDPLAILLSSTSVPPTTRPAGWVRAVLQCKQVAFVHPSAELQAKADKLIATIRAEADKQHVKVD